MKNFLRPIKNEKFKYITMMWVPQTESVAKMCLEHYDTKEYEDTLILIDVHFDENFAYLNPDFFPQKRKIYYNLEHEWGIRGLNDEDYEWCKIFGITEMWFIEPPIGNYAYPFATKYMPMRYADLGEKLIRKGDCQFDLGFVGTIASNSPNRYEFFNKYTFNRECEFSIKILNGYKISDLQYELSNCKFALDLKRDENQIGQNQVRLFEHICLGHTVLSERTPINIFEGLIYEWNDIEMLSDLVNNVKPKDFSDKYKEMTYRDEDYENYKSQNLKLFNSIQKNAIYNIDYHITDVCNQNCISCGHFCPLVPKNTEHKSKEKIKEDLELLKPYADSFYMLTITGGECTLSDNLDYTLDMARKLFPANKISMYTNVTTLATIEKHRECIERNNIHVICSWYPNVGSKVWNIETKISSNYEVRPYVENFHKVQLCGDICAEDYEIERCGARGLCHQLIDGKIYLCQYAAYFNYFDDYFKGQHRLKLNGDEFIDLRNNISGEELVDFCYNKKIEMCYHCLDAKRSCGNYVNEVEWGHSNKNIDEWYLDKNPI